MIYLQTGFVGEGVTDHEFMPPLISRLCSDLASSHSDLEFEIPDPESVLLDDRAGNAPGRIIDRVLGFHPHLDILFYHTDAASDVAGAYRDRVSKVAGGLASTNTRVVGLVPRRETEAWVLSDADALCRVLGMDVSVVDVPPEFRPSRVESITDPKLALSDFRKVRRESSRRSRRSRGDDTFGFLRSLALDIDLKILSQVPQFERARSEVLDYYAENGWLK